MTIESISYLLILLMINALLIVLPFIPAWLEWKNKTDAESFFVNFEDRSMPEYLIRMFKNAIHDHFQTILVQQQGSESHYEGRLSNGIEYHFIGKDTADFLSDIELQLKKTNKMILMCKSGSLPNNMRFSNKIYSAENIIVGSNCVIDEIMSEGEMILKSNVVVQRLTYSNASVIIDKDCNMHGVVRAKNKIQLLENSKFQYLHAPRIEFSDVSCLLMENPINIISTIIPRYFSDKDHTIVANTQVKSNYVAEGNLTIENNCEIFGNIKSYKHIKIADNTTIMGAIISDNDIEIGDNCTIQGPIVSREKITIGKNCCIGTLNVMTSLIGQYVTVSTGTFVGGLLLAKVEGNFSS